MNGNELVVRSTAQMKLEKRWEEGQQSFTSEEIRREVVATAEFFSANDVDIERIVADLEASFQTKIGSERVLEDSDESWEPWLNQRKGSIRWPFWNRYEQYLLRHEGWAAPTLRRLDETTDRVLGLLADPQKEGRWNRRGMVVGDVQSGKTSHYIGLICKAADAGYKLVVVLSGFHKSLRSQTQIRLEEGFLGYDRGATRAPDSALQRVGVGHIDPTLRADSITTRADDGDFQRRVADHFAINPGGHPLLFVVKKNWSVLENLLGWVEWAADGQDEHGRPFVRGVPLLVIDDEADQGSVDTNEQDFDEFGSPDPEHDPTAINQRIRRLLHLFDQSCYVGYTATPFANIFIHEKGRTEEEGEDLFPRNFIMSLPTPSNHVGPGIIFGRTDDPADGSSGIPIVRMVRDHAETLDVTETEGWIPPKHNQHHIPRYEGLDAPPPSLREAIRAFILVCAARMARGQEDVHNSMLVHVTRFTALQGRVAEQVASELTDVQRRLRLGDGDAPDNIWADLEELWESDFQETSDQILREGRTTNARIQPWEEVRPFVARAALSIQLRQINGQAGEVLDYVKHKQSGLNVIAIGGDKLSRGLTLEGLSVSYFLRASRMYDTLMQMGRWFGYRPGYLDLCRLYTTPEMADWFAHIAQASDELKGDFDRMAASGETPKQFGHRVKSHPLLLVTSRVKMRNGQTIDLSYQGDISETISFWRDRERLASNWNATKQLIDLVESRGGPGVRRGNKSGWLWNDVSSTHVLEFLAAYQEHQASQRVVTKLIGDYIRAENVQRRLTDWTIFLAEGDGSEHDETLGAARFKLVQRSWHLTGSNANGNLTQKRELQRQNHYRIGRLVNPPDEWVDLPDAAIKRAFALTVEAWQNTGEEDPRPTRPSGPFLRSVRDPERGLLLLYPLDGGNAGASVSATEKVEPDAMDIPVVGFAASFPGVDPSRASKVRYVVNNIYYQQEVADVGEPGR